MSKKSENDGKKPKTIKKVTQGNEDNMSEYVSALIPDGAIIDFVFYEDFDADGLKEAIVGFTKFTPFPPESSILLIRKTPQGMQHEWLFAAEGPTASERCGIYDNAVAADTDGDGRLNL
jgi:hypothetical protein